MKHTINLAKKPFCPDYLEVEEHIKGSKAFVWNPDKVELFVSKKQKESYIKGNELRRELKDKSVFNANLLDYLLEHQELIPEEWKGKYVFFWGTIYRSSGGDLYVRYLCWGGDGWNWRINWLGNDWDDFTPAVVSYKYSPKSLESKSSLPLELEIKIGKETGKYKLT